jgi:hypothetical protein
MNSSIVEDDPPNARFQTHYLHPPTGSAISETGVQLLIEKEKDNNKIIQ